MDIVITYITDPYNVYVQVVCHKHILYFSIEPSFVT